MTQKIAINILATQFVKLNYRYKFSYKTNYEHNSGKRQIQWSPSNPK